MPSTYTQNLGIELPATGEQANVWGLTVNRNMDTLDTAINGNIQLALSTSPYQLTINDGADSPVAANPVIAWTGPQAAQGTVQIDWQSSRQHLYFMSNQTSGGFGIAFAQGSGAMVVLQAGYDAVIYTNGGGAGASVAQALANPQFGNLLATGNVQVNGTLQVTGTINGIALTPDAQGNLKFTGGLGLGNPTAIPDPLTINGLGLGGQLRLVYSNYGVILRNDASLFYLGVTNAGDPYGASAAWPLEMNLANRTFGFGGWVPDGVHTFNVPSIHASTLALDGGLSVGGGITNTAGRSIFTSGDPYTIGLQYGGNLTYVGTNASGQFVVSNAGGAALLAIDQSGNATIVSQLTVNGMVHTLAGVMFPDGSVQTKAASGFAATPHVVSRSTNTTYTNSTGVLMIVVVSMGLLTNTNAAAWVGQGSASTEVAQVTNYGTTQSQAAPLVFLVPPGWVYQVTFAQQTGPVSLWVEYY